MRRDLHRMAEVEHDLVVVGGGIHGACVALEAAAVGARVALIETADFGSGTSFNSLRVIHGGLRYLQHLDFRRMRESIRARREWLRFAPDLVRPAPFLLPTYGYGARGWPALGLALGITDLVGWDRNQGVVDDARIERGRLLSRRRAQEAYSEFRLEGFNGAACWQDAVCSSTERLLIRVLALAARRGALLANYAEAFELLRTGDRVVGVRVRDGETGDVHDVTGGHVVNAAGPWAFRLLGREGGPRPAPERLYSAAFNLVLRDDRVTRPLGVPVPRRGRDRDALIDRGTNTVFFLPWNGLTLVGTKHVPEYRSAPSGPVGSDVVDAFLTEVNALMVGAPIRRDQVVAVLSGWLPEAGPGDEERDPVLEKHSTVLDHRARDGIDGLTTILGVKWTTSRVVAREVVRRLQARSALPASSALPAAGALPASGATPKGVRLGGRRAPQGTASTSGDPVLEAAGVDVSDVTRAVRAEMARNLADVVLRRTDLWLSGDLGRPVLERCAKAMATERGWGAREMTRQVDRTLSELERLRLGARERDEPARETP